MELLTLQDVPRHYPFHQSHSRRDIDMTDNFRPRPDAPVLPGINSLLEQCDRDRHYQSRSRAEPRAAPLLDHRPVFNDPFSSGNRQPASHHAAEPRYEYHHGPAEHYGSNHTSPRIASSASSTPPDHRSMAIRPSYVTSSHPPQHRSQSLGQQPGDALPWESQPRAPLPSYPSSSAAPPPALHYGGPYGPTASSMYPVGHRASHTYDHSTMDRHDSLGLPDSRYPQSHHGGHLHMHYEPGYPHNQYVMHGTADGMHGQYQRKRRGNLPKEATDYLKNWFSSHRRSPYPTEEEKTEMCHVTGLTLSQVSNWFINARRRNPAKEQKEKERQQQENPNSSPSSGDSTFE